MSNHESGETEESRSTAEEVETEELATEKLNTESPEQKEPEQLSEVLDQVKENTDEGELTLGDVLTSLRQRSFGPVLLLIALIALSPVGAIPGMSVITGSLILLICVQILALRQHPWMPKRLLSISFQKKKLTAWVDRAKKWVKWFEKLIHPRLEFIVQPPVLQIIAAICILLAISFYPLALVPFGVAVPAFAITLFALGITAHDGLLILFGLLVTVGSGWFTWYLLM